MGVPNLIFLRDGMPYKTSKGLLPDLDKTPPLPYEKLDQLVFRHAPLTGVLILGASLYTLVVLVFLMNR